VARGGHLIALLTFPNGQKLITTATEYETLIQHAFGAVAPLAFSTKADAEPYLGHRGAGYLECYQMTTCQALAALQEVLVSNAPEQCDVAMLQACGFAEAEQNRREHALTEKAFQDPHDNTSSVTHTRAYRPRHDSQLFAHAPIRASSIQGATTSQLSHVIHRPDEHADATPNRRTP